MLLGGLFSETCRHELCLICVSHPIPRGFYLYGDLRSSLAVDIDDILIFLAAIVWHFHIVSSLCIALHSDHGLSFVSWLPAQAVASRTVDAIARYFSLSFSTMVFSTSRLFSRFSMADGRMTIPFFFVLLRMQVLFWHMWKGVIGFG